MPHHYSHFLLFTVYGHWSSIWPMIVQPRGWPDVMAGTSGEGVWAGQLPHTPQCSRQRSLQIQSVQGAVQKAALQEGKPVFAVIDSQSWSGNVDRQFAPCQVEKRKRFRGPLATAGSGQLWLGRDTVIHRLVPNQQLQSRDLAVAGQDFHSRCHTEGDLQ